MGSGAVCVGRGCGQIRLKEPEAELQVVFHVIVMTTFSLLNAFGSLGDLHCASHLCYKQQVAC